MPFFRPGSPIFQFLERVANLIILNVLFLICCIPVITIGPALTALYYVSMKMVRNEEESIIRDFFHAFRQNFRQGLLLFLLALAVSIFLGVDMYLLLYSSAVPNEYVKLLLCATGAIIVLFLMILSYTFPILARFHVTLTDCIKASIGVAFSHLPTTISIIAISFFPLLAVFLSVIQIMQIVLPILLVIGFALMAYFQSWFLLRAFRRHTPEEAAGAD